MTHSSSDSAGAMPTPSLVNNKFWTKAQIGYGTAASVVANGYAYMYGATDDSKLAIARSDLNGFLGDLSNKTRYEYYGATPFRRATLIASERCLDSHGAIADYVRHQPPEHDE